MHVYLLSWSGVHGGGLDVNMDMMGLGKYEFRDNGVGGDDDDDDSLIER